MPLSPFARAFLMLASVLAAIFGPTEGLAIGAGTLEPSVDAADDHRPLELGEDPAHLEHGLSRWRRGVQGLLVEVQANACPMDLSEEG